MLTFRRKFSARRKFCLEIFFIRRKKEPLFETAEKVFRNNRSQMSGNPV
jgi:hypothetical protein